MKIGLLTPAPGHPLLAAAVRLLRGSGHEILVLDPRTAAPPAGALADVYLLKSRTPRALALARGIEERGAPVLNSASATARCQNRVEMADLARTHGLPFAATRAAGRLGDIADDLPEGPLVVKSMHSRRDDLVARADTPRRLRELADAWPEEPVVVQEFTANSGWDHKLWVINGTIFAGLRRSELSPDGRGPTLPLPPAELPPSWTAAALAAGEVFALDVYGVDILDAGGGNPLLVDVNAFPGIRGQAGAPEALADLTLRVGCGAFAPLTRTATPAHLGAGGNLP